VKCGLIAPLTKEESAAKIKFFTLAKEQRAIQREAEQYRLMHPDEEVANTED